MAEIVLFDLLHLELVSPLTCSGNEFDASKLENMGCCTGYRLVERLTKDWTRFKNELDIMKFICKVFWFNVFRKEINYLRSNNQGVYILQDDSFKFLRTVSHSDLFFGETPNKYLAFTCGLVRGALMNLGIISVVTGDASTSPNCKFQVVVHRI